MSRTLASLDDAIEWAEAHWAGQRPAPIRLHRAHATDGALGAPAFTLAFAKALDQGPDAQTYATTTVACYHPMLPYGRSPRDCPECWGNCVKDVRVDRYSYPMSRALDRLSNVLRPRRQPHPFRLVMALVDHAWDWRATARSLDMHPDLAEALLLRALRQLHGRYEEGPVRLTWVDKSEAQAEGLPAA